MTRDAKDARVAPNIYQTPYGWRVYVRRRDPETGRSRLKPIRFPPETTLEELEHFRDSYKLESKRLRREARTAARAEVAALRGAFVTDARAYLALKTTQAMPSYKDRARDIELWIAVFGRRARGSIPTRAIDEHLQQWIDEGYAASTVNNRRTALMALWTRLDGRGAANPVREARVYAEPELAPRGWPYALLVRVLDAIPTERTYSHLRDDTKRTPIKTRAFYEALAWTGMRPSQLNRMTAAEHVHFEEGWFVTPRSKKGSKRPRHPRPLIRKPLTADAAAALRRWFAVRGEKPMSPSSARRLFTRAVRQVEGEIRAERNDPSFSLPRFRPALDTRHSYGTAMLRQTKSLETVAELLDHTTTRMTKRYSLGAVPDVLQEAGRAFEASTTGGARTPATSALKPKAPRPRGNTTAGNRRPVSH
jgi:site-specific recombinase XerC